MEVIFGEISFSTKRQKINVKLKNILNRMYPVYKNYSFKTESFDGGIILHPTQKSSSEDFFYCDNESHLSVFSSGVVYNLDDLLQEEKNAKCMNYPAKLLFLYKKHGESFINYLNGDFSIVIIDLIKKRALLYRDHLGIRPLAYFIKNHTIYFSSDYTSLCRSFDENGHLNQRFLIQLLQNYSYIDYSELPTVGITKLIPGHYVTWQNETLINNKYWFPEKINLDYSIDQKQIIQDIKKIVEDSVNIRCNDTSNAATHFSGGLDSGLVAALTQKNYKHQSNFYGFSWSPDKLNNYNVVKDERDLISEMVRNNQIKPVYYSTDINQYWKNLSDWSDLTIQFYEKQVLENCQKLGINLLFSGWGGDEFLSINNRGLFFDLFFRLNWITLLKKKPIKPVRSFIGMLIFDILCPVLGIYHYRKPLDKWSYKYFKAPYNSVKLKREKKIFRYRARRTVHLKLLYNYHIPWRIENETILGFRNGVEYRYPLLDKRIIEFMLRVPSKLLADFPYPRPIIREISKGILPENLRLHIPKEDASRLTYLCELYDKTLPLFLDELKYFKTNPDLDFLNFELLEKDIISLQNKTYKNDRIDFLVLLNNIKKVHEFTKGYRNLGL